MNIYLIAILFCAFMLSIAFAKNEQKKIILAGESYIIDSNIENIKIEIDDSIFDERQVFNMGTVYHTTFSNLRNIDVYLSTSSKEVYFINCDTITIYVNTYWTSLSGIHIDKNCENLELKVGSRRQ